MSLFFFFFCSSALFAFASSRPQTDPGNAISEGDVRVPILDQESNAPEIDYNRLGSPSACGFSSKNLSSIARTGGGVARLRDWPWMGAILRKNDQFHFCGGALISQRRLLTAAHCVYNLKKEDIFVRLGEYDFTRENDTQINDFDVTRMQIHDDWDSGTFENDIAILTFNEPVRYNFYTQPICLPLPVQDFTNTTAVVAGWGSIMFGGPMSDILLEVPVPVWDQKRCVDQFTQTIFSTVQCAAAYEGGKDACQGDSGGPLMSQREDGRWITIGIVSWGINCGEKDKPGIYTRVNRYLDWIAEKLQE